MRPTYHDAPAFQPLSGDVPDVSRVDPPVSAWPGVGAANGAGFVDIAPVCTMIGLIHDPVPGSMLIADLHAHAVIDPVDLPERLSPRAAAHRQKSVPVRIETHDLADRGAGLKVRVATRQNRDIDPPLRPKMGPVRRLLGGRVHHGPCSCWRRDRAADTAALAAGLSQSIEGQTSSALLRQDRRPRAEAFPCCVSPCLQRCRPASKLGHPGSSVLNIIGYSAQRRSDGPSR